MFNDHCYSNNNTSNNTTALDDSTTDRLRRELLAKDEALFDLQTTVASIQAESTLAQAHTQSQIRQLQEDLRRVQQEANVAHSRAVHWQSKIAYQNVPNTISEKKRAASPTQQTITVKNVIVQAPPSIQKRASIAAAAVPPGVCLAQHLLTVLDHDYVPSYISTIISSRKYVQKDEVCLHLLKECIHQSNATDCNTRVGANMSTKRSGEVTINMWKWLFEALRASPEVCKWLVSCSESDSSTMSASNRIRSKNGLSTLQIAKLEAAQNLVTDPLLQDSAVLRTNLQQSEHDFGARRIFNLFLDTVHQLLEPARQKSIELATLILRTMNVMILSTNSGMPADFVTRINTIVKDYIERAWRILSARLLDNLRTDKYSVPRRIAETKDEGAKNGRSKTGETTVTGDNKVADTKAVTSDNNKSKVGHTIVSEDDIHSWLTEAMVFLRLAWKHGGEGLYKIWIDSGILRRIVCALCDLMQYYIMPKIELYDSKLAYSCIDFLTSILTADPIIPAALHLLRLQISTSASTAKHYSRGSCAVDLVAKFAFLITQKQQENSHLSKNLVIYNAMVPTRDACIVFMDRILRLVTRHRLDISNGSSTGNLLFSSAKVQFSSVVVEHKDVYTSALEILLRAPPGACQVNKSVKNMAELQLEELRIDYREKLSSYKRSLKAATKKQVTTDETSTDNAVGTS